MEGLFAWLLLPLGIALGWALRRNPLTGGAAPATAQAGELPGHHSVPQDVDTPNELESQLALGEWLRRRGEIDRAINLHRSLLERPGLAPSDADVARVELAQDYLKAGLLDHAESLLHELGDSGVQLAPTLELLLDLYEQARDWPQAIVTARRLQAVKGQSVGPRIAQYWCERAEVATAAGDAAATQMLQSALEADSECVRATLLQAVRAEAAQDWESAKRACWRAMQQDGRFFADVAPMMERYCQKAESPESYRRFIEEAMTSLAGSAAAPAAKARWLRAQGSPVREFLSGHLATLPSREGLLLWMEGGKENEPVPPGLQGLTDWLKKSVKERPRYACVSCGLQPGLLFWQCPRCRQWGSVKPAEDRL